MKGIKHGNMMENNWKEIRGYLGKVVMQGLLEEVTFE